MERKHPFNIIAAARVLLHDFAVTNLCATNKIYGQGMKLMLLEKQSLVTHNVYHFITAYGRTFNFCGTCDSASTKAAFVGRVCFVDSFHVTRLLL
jgi:hypothetical protein